MPTLNREPQAPLATIFRAELDKPTAKTQPNEAAAHLADLLLGDAIRAGASDIHMDPGRDTVAIRYRVDGLMRDQAAYPKALPIIARIRVMANLPPTAVANTMPEEGIFEFGAGGRQIRARVSVYPCGFGDNVVIRLLDSMHANQTPERLGFLPEQVKSLNAMTQKTQGIFLVSGGTGSGKTTTLCTILQSAGKQDVTTVTLEDPIEYQLPRVVHTQINPKFGLTFAEGLRAMLRQDPNIIMVGEIRDQETADVAFRAAMTGHMIFSTIHATSACGVIARLLGMEVEPFLISSFLVGAMAQRLVRRICAQCAQPAMADGGLVEALLQGCSANEQKAFQAILTAPGAKFSVGKGCAACSGTGYKGRVGIYEILPVSTAIGELVLKKPTIDELLQQALKSGHKTLYMDGATKAWAGWTTLDELLRVFG